MRRFLISFFLLAPFVAPAQSIDSTVHASQFPGTTVAQKVTAAKASCSNIGGPCWIVIDPSLASFPQGGALPALGTNQYLLDYRSGFGYSGPFDTALNDTMQGNSTVGYIQNAINGINIQSDFQLEQGGGNGVSAVSGGALVPSTANIHQANGVAGFVRVQSAQTNGVGVYGQGICDAINAQCWGANFLAATIPGFAGQIAKTLEIDDNFTNTSDVGDGVEVDGYWTAQPTTGQLNAFNVNPPNNNYLWETAYNTTGGSSVNALVVGPAHNAANNGSQNILLQGYNASGSEMQTTVYMDNGGNFVVNPPATFHEQIAGDAAYLPGEVITAPSLATGHGLQNFWGVSTTTNNAVTEQFNYGANGSAANSFCFSLYGSSFAFCLNGNGEFKTPSSELNSGHVYTRHTIVTASLTPASVAANTCAAQTLTVSGLNAGDHVINRDVEPSFINGLSLDGVLVTAANTATMNWCNNTGAAITPPSGTYTFDVEQ